MKNYFKRAVSILISFTIAIFVLASSVSAQNPEAGGSTKINTGSGYQTVSSEDKRVLRLKNYLKGYPLETSAEQFIAMANKYGLEKHPYLVAAIGGLESTYGQFIPPGSFNAWGFGIPTGAQSGIVFKNWGDGVEEVTKTIVQVYLKNQDPEKMTNDELIYFIGPIYAASPTWAQRVSFITNQIENAPATPSSTAALPLDL